MDRKHQHENKSKRRKRKSTAETTPMSPNLPQHKKHHFPERQNIIEKEQHTDMSLIGQQPLLDFQSNTPVEVIHRLPPIFPTNMIRPQKGFLRNVPPYQKSFQLALQTSYEGFVVDLDVLPNEQTIQATLQSPEMATFFVTDVTQPFGLGTVCSPTYVTRCLMGDSGTTYKYLGLRMFAHPWNAPIRELKEHLSSRVTHRHLPQLFRHRQATTTAMASNSNIDPSKIATTTITTNIPHQQNVTKPCFDICLINRMTMNKKLKTEPLDEQNKITVSWHADSSLEHYSTIAVYQTIVSTVFAPDHKPDSVLGDSERCDTSISSALGSNTKMKDNEWSIGLRVSPNVEGPKMNHSRNKDDNDNVVDVAPPIAVSLPSNSAYYLLDDFNHHHQHTVLVHKQKSSMSPSIRYSLTFRLLRDSHNVIDMINRCQRCILQFHKKGSKTYRFEQLTLNELESEWLRQFYIQGCHHHEILWDEWSNSFMKLWDYWNQLEMRTFHTVQLLGYAAEGRCFNKTNVQNNESAVTGEHTEDQRNSKANSALKFERKLRTKRKKSVSSILELLKRESTATETTPNQGQTMALFESFAAALEERATMRELWLSREADPIFKKMSAQHRPIPFPAIFEYNENSNIDVSAKSTTNNKDPAGQTRGLSPMPGTSVALRNLARTIRAWGHAFLSCDMIDLPAVNPLDHALHQTATTCEKNSFAGKSDGEDTTVVIDNANIVPMNWDGWKTHDFGLEMQYPWSNALIDGRKSIEIRRYTLPSSLLGRKIYIIETPEGKDAVSGIVGNHFQSITTVDESQNDICCEVSTSIKQPRIVGWSVFSMVKQYKSREDFCIDEKLHLVPIDSAYGWQNGETNELFGWVVSEYGRVIDNDAFVSSGFRRFRSLFQLAHAEDKTCIEGRRPTDPTFPDAKQDIASEKSENNFRNRGRAANVSSVRTKKRRY